MASHHESTLLRPRDPSLLNSDYWPGFELKNVNIFASDDPNASPVSLLHAGIHRPLTVTGKLEPPNEANAHAWLKTPTHRGTLIELTHVKEFSYGQYQDGSLEIWAEGQAGWFSIRPGRVYRDTYNAMVEAVKVLYYMADTYKSTRRYSDLPAADFFRRFFQEQPGLCNSIAGAEAVFEKHRLFLIASMLTGKEGLHWYRTPLFSYIEAKYPDDVQLVRQRIGVKPVKASSRKGSTLSPAPSTASTRQQRAAERAAVKERSATPQNALPKRNTRSTRSQSTTTNDSTAIPNARPSHSKRPQSRQVVSTPRQSGKHVNQDIQSSSEEEDEIRGGGRKAAKGRSALRPKTSKYIPVLDDNDQDATPAAQVKKHAVKVQSEEPEESSLASSDHEQADVVKLGAEEDSDMEIDEIEEEGDDAEEPSSLPFRLREAEQNGDMWQCPVDGCMHKVYAASEPSSTLLIKAHEQTHESDDDERIQLVRRMEAPWLPVNRLMERVRERAAFSKLPPPVVQRY